MAGGIDVKRAVGSLDMPIHRYMVLMVMPAVVGSVGLSALLVAVIGDVFTGWASWIPYAIPLFATGSVLMYPFQAAERRRHLIDHNMHYFITHMGVLATSDVPRVELFRLLGQKEHEYGPLAGECDKVAVLVLKWNLSLAEACRFVARRTPSQLLSDFLERFAFGVESGADVEPYLAAEQEVVMAEYETLYKATLYNIEGLKGMYGGVMTTLIFLAMFGLLMPILVGGSATIILLLVVVGAMFLQAGFIMYIRVKVPPDHVWADTGQSSPLWQRVRWALPAAGLLSAVLAPTLVVATDWPLPIVIAATVTPLLLPGWLAGREEEQVKRRDDNYPAFMRSLGASTAARGGDAREVLRHLRHHDFGPLTHNIRALFARLQLRVDDEASWRYFTTEAGSRLVERFTRMFDEAVSAGGRPDDVGRIISDNMVAIVHLRKLRYQEAGSFRGTLYGMAAGTAFAMFTGIGVLAMLVGIFAKAAMPNDLPISVPTLIHTEGVHIPTLELIILMMLLANAAVSAVMVRMVDGGTPVRALSDFGMLVWVSNLTALGSAKFMAGVMGSSFGV